MRTICAPPKAREINLRVEQRVASLIDLRDVDAFMGMHNRILREELARDAELVTPLPPDVLAALREAREAAMARADHRWKEAKAALKAGRDPLDDAVG
jgi:hypothetical protein